MAFLGGGTTKRRDEVRAALDLDEPIVMTRLRRVQVFVRRYWKFLLYGISLAVSASLTVYTFNSLTMLRQNATNAEAQIASAMQMRQNLVPALTVLIRQFTRHERNIFLTAVQAREDSLRNMGVADEAAQKVMAELSQGPVSPGSLAKLMAVAENYPQLVSNQAYQLLIAQATEAEKRIFEQRLLYNDAVNLYNTRLAVFPTNITGFFLGFRQMKYFEWLSRPEWLLPADVITGEGP
ncbi:MAG: LemA family protein [Candidatus Omnitrophica bacterium]|nr:LemA family protein [Candidatus Omnitrophota bacterium]